MADIADRVASLERDLRQVFGDRLQSFIAYGPPQEDHRDNHDEEAHAAAEADDSTRTHTLAIVDTIRAEDLAACAARVAGWHGAGLATPLLLAGHEFENSLDAFPLEFGAIVAHHVVVSGRNPFDGLSVDPADLRRACEVQARSHLLHLREGYLETRGRADALAVLIVRSAAPFAALIESVTRLEGLAASDRGTAARHAERLLDVTGGIVSEVLHLVGVQEISSDRALRLFPAYLDAVQRLVAYVDRWAS